MVLHLVIFQRTTLSLPLSHYVHIICKDSDYFAVSMEDLRTPPFVFLRGLLSFYCFLCCLIQILTSHHWEDSSHMVIFLLVLFFKDFFNVLILFKVNHLIVISSSLRGLVPYFGILGRLIIIERVILIFPLI